MLCHRATFPPTNSGFKFTGKWLSAKRAEEPEIQLVLKSKLKLRYLCHVLVKYPPNIVGPITCDTLYHFSHYYLGAVIVPGFMLQYCTKIGKLRMDFPL